MGISGTIIFRRKFGASKHAFRKHESNTQQPRICNPVFAKQKRSRTAKFYCGKIRSGCRTVSRTESRINDAVGRILAYKKKYASPNADTGKKSGKEPEQFVKSLFRDSIRFTNRKRGYSHLLGENPVFLSCYAYRSTLASSRLMDDLLFAVFMQKRFGGDAYSFSINPDSGEINEILEKVRSKGYTNLVLGTHNGHLNRGQSSLAKELEKLKIPMVMAAFRNPYDLDEVGDGVDKIAAYEYSIQSIEAVVPLFKK